MILLGSAKVHTIKSDGTQIILAVLGPGEVVGEMSLADSLRRLADVTTLEEAVLLWMDRFAFRTALEEEPMLICNLAEVLSRRLRLTNAHLLSLDALDVPGRVASQLLALAREYGERTPEGTRIPMRLTQTDLASLVGASRMRVGQAIALFKKRGCFSVGEDHRIVIQDPETLTRRAH
jgi:CRP/FNR family transcriptional regulator, cyclic AMP receptor protein